MQRTREVDLDVDMLAVDPQTGVLYPVVGGSTGTITINEKPRSNNGRGRGKQIGKRDHMSWGLLDFERFALLELRPTEYRVLATIAGQINPQTNTVRLSRMDISRSLDMAPSMVTKAIKELKSRNLVFELTKNQWRINYWLAYRGSVAEWEEVTRSDPEPVYAA